MYGDCRSDNLLGNLIYAYPLWLRVHVDSRSAPPPRSLRLCGERSLLTITETLQRTHFRVQECPPDRKLASKQPSHVGERHRKARADIHALVFQFRVRLKS